MIKRNIVLLALLCLLALFSPFIVPAQVQVEGQGNGQITVSNSTAQMNFPLSLSFSSQINSNVNITDIRLKYKIEQMSFAQVTSESYVNFNPGTSVNARAILDMRRIGGVPPGTHVDYWWSVRDASGASLETSPIGFQVNDNRYNWQKLSQDKINIFWYSGNNSFAQALMSKAQQSLVQLAADTGASPEETVDIYIYASAEDLRGSMIFPQEWTGGVAFTQFNIIAIGISPANLEWGLRAMTHELTHIVIHQVTFNPYSGLPVWLDEGLAMYSEGALTTQFSQPLRNAVSNNILISLRSLSSPFSAYTEKSLLSYAQSYSVVDYLISRYSPVKMLELLNTFKQGSTYDSALKKIYGFDMDGLDNEWRAWIAAR